MSANKSPKFIKVNGQVYRLAAGWDKDSKDNYLPIIAEEIKHSTTYAEELKSFIGTLSGLYSSVEYQAKGAPGKEEIFEFITNARTLLESVKAHTYVLDTFVKHTRTH
jgi:hypothetical protein